MNFRYLLFITAVAAANSDGSLQARKPVSPRDLFGREEISCLNPDIYCEPGWGCCPDGTCAPLGSHCCGGGHYCEAGSLCADDGSRCLAVGVGGNTLSGAAGDTLTTPPPTTRTSIIEVSTPFTSTSTSLLPEITSPPVCIDANAHLCPSTNDFCCAAGTYCYYNSTEFGPACLSLDTEYYTFNYFYSWSWSFGIRWYETMTIYHLGESDTLISITTPPAPTTAPSEDAQTIAVPPGSSIPVVTDTPISSPSTRFGTWNTTPASTPLGTKVVPSNTSVPGAANTATVLTGSGNVVQVPGFRQYSKLGLGILISVVIFEVFV